MTSKNQQIANRTIFEGDNLDILRGMNSDSVDMIYLDPPFNSNADYSAPIGSTAAGAAFKDTWTWDDVKAEEHGLIADQAPELYDVIKAAGSAHGKGMMAYLIMMSSRMMELKRVLKDTGSIYLHCDSNASHYLKAMMDVVFGTENFRNDITWRRQAAHSDGKGFWRIADQILFYGTSIDKDAVRIPLSGDRAKSYRMKDSVGRFVPDNISAKGLSGGGYTYDFHGHSGPWRYPEHRIRELEKQGRIYIPSKPGGVPRLKRYLHENKGIVPGSIWTDIPPVQSHAKERVGYPTQKPLQLLERIIKASSQPGEVVLDPFCGCATTCIAAERLERQWIGIDLSPLAVRLVQQRARNDLGMIGGLQTIHRTDIPKRTDLGQLPNYRTHKHTLFGKQEGICKGCLVAFPFRNFTVDHIVPRNKGGHDHIDNLQLLCGACNSTKGNGSMAELIAKLREQGIRD